MKRKEITAGICNPRIQFIRLSNAKQACDTVFIIFNFTSDFFNTNIYCSMEWRNHEKSRNFKIKAKSYIAQYVLYYILIT
jgi:hypothetical protein